LSLPHTSTSSFPPLTRSTFSSAASRYNPFTAAHLIYISPALPAKPLAASPPKGSGSGCSRSMGVENDVKQ